MWARLDGHFAPFICSDTELLHGEAGGIRWGMKLPLNFLTAILALGCAQLSAETVKDREGAVRKDRATMENDARWIYNDVDRGFSEAAKSGKPLLVVLRCVPCVACAGIDASVLTETSLAPLLDRFVCVRLINANALDLQKFQFDYDLSFSAMMFHCDGTVLGRFGSWTHQKDAQNTTIAGLRCTLEASLALHSGYPGNKMALAGKQGGVLPFKTPIEFPLLSGKYRSGLDWEGKVVQSCVHCHQIGDAIRTHFRDAGQAIPAEMVYPMPAPETLGFTLSPDHAARITNVVAGSPAALAGFQIGDDLTVIAGQSLVSIADASWALHRAPESGRLPSVIQREGKAISMSLVLPAGWRQKTDISRRVGTWPMRAMATGGMTLEDLPDADRTAHGLDSNGLSLLVKGVGQYGKHAAAKNAGFQKNDVIVKVDGDATRRTEGEFIGWLIQQRRPGDKVPVTVLRGQKRIELKLPMQ